LLEAAVALVLAWSAFSSACHTQIAYDAMELNVALAKLKTDKTIHR